MSPAPPARKRLACKHPGPCLAWGALPPDAEDGELPRAGRFSGWGPPATQGWPAEEFRVGFSAVLSCLKCILVSGAHICTGAHALLAGPAGSTACDGTHAAGRPP